MPIEYNPSILNKKTYQMATLQDKADSLRNRGVDIINATIGDPKDDTPNGIQTALIKSIESHTFSQYPAYIGKLELRQAIQAWATKKYGILLNENTQICACNGTKEAIFSLPLIFDWANEKQILFPSLSYPIYKLSAEYFNIPFTEINVNETNNFVPSLMDVSTTILEKTQLVWLNSPHNPTSAVFSKTILAEYVRLAEKYNFIICSDECYNDLYETNAPASILEFDSEHWICFRSLSKRSHMTGYRSGAILSKNKGLMTQLKKARAPMGIGTPSFIQDAATWSWQDEDHVKLHREHYNQKRRRLKNVLNSVGFNVFGGEAGFYMWVKSNQHQTSESLAEWFLDRNILVTPGTIFGNDGNPYVRIVFCLKDSVLTQMINRIQS
ncbi:MAG: aminotransferase class I/II-fold pyridoxal phosphate-dependent enzyme [Candidatus Margulisiibacteriota bacterium]